MIRKSIHIIIFIWVVVINLPVLGQPGPNFTQYSFNRFLVNPAFAGIDGYTNISLTAREQWVGFKGTPKIHALTIDSKFYKKSFINSKLSIFLKEKNPTRNTNVGWGTQFYSDRNGPLGITGINGTYSYHIPMGENQLSFGLSLQFSQIKLNGEDFILADGQPDLSVSNGLQSLWTMNSNFGVLFVNPQFHAGYSTLQWMGDGIQFANRDLNSYDGARYHYFIGGYKYILNSDTKIEPSVLLKISEQAGAQFQLNSRVVLKDTYWAGINFSTGSSMALFGGLKIKDYLIGYAFDVNFNSMIRNSLGSHEFVVALQFGENASKYRWLKKY